MSEHSIPDSWTLKLFFPFCGDQEKQLRFKQFMIRKKHYCSTTSSTTHLNSLIKSIKCSIII